MDLGWMSLYTNRKKFTRENVLKLDNGGGLYQFYNKQGVPIYIGRTAGNKDKYGLKHRVSSYLQIDDFNEHPTKKALRPKIHSFSVLSVEDKKRRRMMEMQLKKGLHGNGKLKHNHY
ncbi:MAG: hypothetical protein CMI54_08775 [Parcubacteria group bacterium]|jgi:excinuclease UvrABC nuclease subunit|nr:hypothetical protein [Parcubacteria group bacterium]|tara:strand:+ start:324 stop:674 length:351 start_codon:yes stop_codon:yes gene_type:complete